MPTAVLSNNDGCIVARSNEVKKIGIPMGAPVFKWKDLIERHNVRLLSANFQLYGDLSNRIMSILRTLAKDVQIYSIDEAFIPLDNMHIKDYEGFGLKLRDQIMKWVGVPVSIGIAPTKTLAKAANEFSKKYMSHTKGVLVLKSEKRINFILNKLDIGDIWGVGYAFTEKLKRKGIYSALDFKKTNSSWVRDYMGVVGQRTHLELNGASCIEIHTNEDSRKTIMSSRSFGKSIVKYDDLRESIVSYIARALEKLRNQNSLCSFLTVYIRSSKYNDNLEENYSNSITAALPYPTDVDFTLIKHADIVLRKIFKDGINYKKAAVVLSGIVPRRYENLDLFLADEILSRDKKSKTMKVMDNINKEFGRNTMLVGSQRFNPKWVGKKESRSPRYTSSWLEIPVVRI